MPNSYYQDQNYKTWTAAYKNKTKMVWYIVEFNVPLDTV